MKTFSSDCDFMLKSSEKTFSFSLLQFLTSEDFVDQLVFQRFSEFPQLRNNVFG